MNPLDELFSSTGQVRGITPDGMRNARAALDEAIAEAGTQHYAATGQPDAPARRSRSSRWPRGLHGKTIIGVAALAAAGAAAATVLVLPSPSTSAKLADAPPRQSVTAPETAAAKASPTAPAATTAPVLATVAARFMDKAARAAGSQQGWPNASYWYVKSEGPCGGQMYTSQAWFSRYGNGVVDNTGPKSSNPLCAGATGEVPFTGDEIFGPYTWSQLYALPTNAAQLRKVLLAYTNSPVYQSHWMVTPATANSDFFQFIMGDLLSESPASPALREALYEVAAQIPGVEDLGSYTDPLGRTGTALKDDPLEVVIDPATGQVLETIQSPPPLPAGCKSNGDCGNGGWIQTTPMTSTYITEGPVSSEPTLPATPDKPRSSVVPTS
jgi:hypothetical protein